MKPLSVSLSEDLLWNHTLADYYSYLQKKTYIKDWSVTDNLSHVDAYTCIRSFFLSDQYQLLFSLLTHNISIC